VSALELGVPVSLKARPSHPRAGAAAAPSRSDGRVLAFAARTHESTLEEWLPRGAGLAKARLQGIFTHAVVQALGDGVGTSQSLRDAILQQYRQAGRVAPVPQVVGAGRLPAPIVSPTPPRTGG
jgi:hypothetical protein